jgi:DNA mismatch endonuclease (patch repair protein)
VDRVSEPQRRENMRRIRSTDSVPEMVVRKLVHGMGFRYRLHVQNLPGRPDLVFPRLKKVIQVHGCFWHQHEGCRQSHIPKSRLEYWTVKLANNVRRDRENEGKLISLGWTLLTLWECELSDTKRLSKRLTQFLLTT